MSSSSNFMSSRSTTDIEELARKINNDAKKMENAQRFGYFSIQYPSHIGDRFYSQGKKKLYRTEEKKVITEPRGIYTTTLKKGKFPDAYFSNLLKTDKQIQAQIAEMAEKERHEYLASVKKRKEKNSQNFKESFLPSGPQEYKDFTAQNPVVYNVAIDKFIDKTLKIDKEKKSVFTEKRGIFTNPPHRGASTTPGLLFSAYKEDKNMLKMKPKKLTSQMKNVNEYEFKPASVNKNEPFHTDKEIFGEDERQLKALLKETIEV